MRYYVIAQGPPAYILLEVVREQSDDGRFRETNIAAGVGGPTSSTVTDIELNATQGGRDLLSAWRSGDNDRFDAEERRFADQADALEAAASRAREHLVLIGGGLSHQPDRGARSISMPAPN